MAEKKYLGSEGLISLVANVLVKLQGYVPTSRKVNNKTLTEDITLTYSDVGADQSGAAASSLISAKDYADEKIEAVTSGNITVAEATHAASADSATTATSSTKATQDGNGKVIADTYETKADADATETALTALINGKANASHNHAISEVTNLQSSLDAKVPTSRTVNGKALTSNITLSASDVSAYSKTEIDSKVSTINSAISGKEASGTAASAVSTHNTDTDAHNDIRDLIDGLTTRLNALANSTDEDLDQMAEIVAYIKSNKSLIDSITTSKVNVADIVNNLTTNVTNKPLSAAQGVAIKSLIDTLQGEVDANENNISNVQTKLNGIEDGAQVNVQADWNENDSSSDAYIENRPFYTGDPVLITVVDNVTFTTTDYNGLGAAQRPFTLVLEEGVEYVVTWNGVDYTTTCTVMDGMLAIGNGSIFGMAADTGEPFIIGYAGSIMLYATSVGEVTITVKKNDAEVHKLSSKYIDFPLGSYVGELTDVGEIFNDYENNVASGSYSHAEGSYTEASGHWSHAEGYHAKAYGQWSHAEGYATKARGQAQHVQGKYNIEDTAGDYAHIVGNGTSSVRANIHTLDWDGGAWYKGGIKVGGTSYADADEVATKAYVDASAGGQVQFITWESTD